MLVKSASPTSVTAPTTKTTDATSATTSGHRRRPASGSVIAATQITEPHHGASSPHPVARYSTTLAAVPTASTSARTTSLRSARRPGSGRIHSTPSTTGGTALAVIAPRYRALAPGGSAERRRCRFAATAYQFDRARGPATDPHDR